MKRTHDSSFLQPLPLWKVADIKHELCFEENIGGWRTWFQKPKETFSDGIQFDEISSHIEKAKKQKTTTPNKKRLTTFTVGIRPTLQQKQALELQIRVTNQTYNWCVWLVQEKGEKIEVLQNIVVMEKENIPSDLRMPVNLKTETGEWLTPEDMKKGDDDWYFEKSCKTSKLTALKRFIVMNSHYKSKLGMKYKKEQLHPSNGDTQYKSKLGMKYKKEQLHPSNGVFGIKKENVKWVDERHIEMLPVTDVRTHDGKGLERKGKIRVNKKQHKVPPLLHDMTIVKRPNGKYVMSVPCEPRWTRSAKIDPDCQNICGIDPGVRTFITGVNCTDGIIFEFGKKIERKKLVRPYFQKEDSITSLMEKARENGHTFEEESRRRQLQKMLYKRKQRIDMLHSDAIVYLLKNYRLISIGKLHDVKCRAKTGKGIDFAVARNKYVWSHEIFLKRLVKRTEGSDCKVIVQDETFTSKTCCRCNGYKKDLGTNEVFCCDECKLSIARDVNGAINILRKTLNFL
jgi:transposase